MKFPKLKQALLCRILPYVIVLGGFVLPIVVVCCLDFIPEGIRVAVVFALMIGLMAYLFKNFAVLMGMDMALAVLRCNLSARTRYDLPRNRSAGAIEKSICRFGTACEPAPIQPQPFQLRYRFNASATVYTKGIEKVVAAYEADLLDAEQYRAIFSSAKTNSKALTGRKKPRFLDKEQKKAPLNRVTVIVIFAHKVEEKLRQTLYEQVCKQCGDEWEDTVVPCVIDMEKGQCVFNSERLPYIGFAYPVKNRGVRLVQKMVFGGHISLKGNHNYVEPIKDVDTEQSLWDFWGSLVKEMKDGSKKMSKRMASMADGQILLEENLLYIKRGERAVCLWVERDEEKKTAEVESVSHWSYPKTQPIARKTIQEIQTAITRYFADQGYGVTFEEMDV